MEKIEQKMAKFHMFYETEFLKYKSLDVFPANE